MQRFSSALAGAAVSFAVLAGSAPAQAAVLMPTPAVLTGDQQAADIQTVGDRRGRHRSHRFRGHDSFALGFGFGFGAPFIGSSYAYRPYRYSYSACPYGTFYEPAYGGCVVAYNRYPAYSYPYGYGRSGLPLDYRER
jgi:hypothetical protein